MSPASTSVPVTAVVPFAVAVFVALITGFLISSVGVSFTVALFIIEPSAPSSTTTLNVTVASPAMSASPSAPFVAASTFTSIPFTKSSAVSSLFAIPSTTMLPATKLVPSGIVSLIIAFPLAYPLLYAVIVYSISSPTTTADLFDVFSDVIIGSWYSVSVSGVSSPFTVATFLIVSPLSKSPTVTSKLTVVSPATSPTLAGTSTSIPFAKSSAVCSVTVPFTFMLPLTNVVPSGIVSATVAFPATSPVFVTVIVYVIVSPAFTSVLSATLLALITGFLTSSVGLSFTYALLDIVPVAPLFTVTWNVTVVVPAFSPNLAGTFTSIPLAKSSAVNSLFATPATTMLPSTNVVFSGIVSFTFIVPGTIPVFVALIVYVITSPDCTAVLSAVFS